MDKFDEKAVAKKIISVLKPMGLTVAEIREVLSYLNKTIDCNAVLK